MNANKHNKAIGRGVSPNTSRPLSKGCSLIRSSVPIAGSNNQRDAMGRTAYAGIRKCGHDGCGFAPRSTVRNLHFCCDLSQLDLTSQITGEAARRLASDMRWLHESMAGVVMIDLKQCRRVATSYDKLAANCLADHDLAADEFGCKCRQSIVLILRPAPFIWRVVCDGHHKTSIASRP